MPNKPIAYYHNRCQILSNSNLKSHMTHTLDLDLLSLKLSPLTTWLKFQAFSTMHFISTILQLQNEDLTLPKHGRKSLDSTSSSLGGMHLRDWTSTGFPPQPFCIPPQKAANRTAVTLMGNRLLGLQNLHGLLDQAHSIQKPLQRSLQLINFKAIKGTNEIIFHLQRSLLQIRH